MGEPTAEPAAPEACPHPGELVRELRHLLLSLQLSGMTERLLVRPQQPAATAAVSATPPPSPVEASATLAAPLAATLAATPDPARADRLQELRRDLGDCRRCRLHAGRHQLVFGDGSPGARLVFVGEGPGEDEDRQGRPFVGKAGKLLDRMIEAMGLERARVYICNVVKCRPPGNRTPLEDEIATCCPFLFQQLEAIRPRVICALGAAAAQTLTQKKIAVGQLRRSTHFWRGTPLVVTYHPAYLLRSPAQKAAVWQDLREVLKLLE